MIKYKIDWLNGGVEIENPDIKWTFAGFSRNELGEVKGIEIHALLITEKAKFSIILNAEGTATNRTDAAIDAICLQLLEKYKV
jgi:hypothetical protein